MLEVEVKKRFQGDLEVLRERIKSLGFKLLEKHVEIDIYYTHPCRDFRETDEALRVRVRDDGIYELTYKGPKIGCVGKVREELTVQIRDIETLTKILERLGFREFMRVKKLRETYSNGETTISIDDVEGLGVFVEIERKCEGVEVENVLSKIEELFLMLGISGRGIRKSYLELLLEKLKPS